MLPRIHRLFSRWLLPPAAALLAAQGVAAMSPADLAARLARNERILVIDVRSASAYLDGHIPGAINIPLSLLPHKPIPSVPLVVVYGDGLGVVSQSEALASVRSKGGVTAESIEGGYAAWIAATRLSTALPGVARENLPGITYQQLLAAGKDDLVLVDLRAPSAPARAAASTVGGRAVAAAQAPDLLAEFATKLAVPVVRNNTPLELATASAGSPRAASTGEPARAAMPADGGGVTLKLLVLVADSESAANEAARQLRASGHHRFTILIGGMEIIRHEGRQGSGRMVGGLPADQRQP